MIGRCEVCGLWFEGKELIPTDTGGFICVTCRMEEMLDFDTKRVPTGGVDW